MTGKSKPEASEHSPPADSRSNLLPEDVSRGAAEWLYGTTSRGLGAYRVIGSVERDLDEDELSNLKKRLGYALEHFPELNGRTVTVAKKPEDHSWYAEADLNNDIIHLPTHEPCPYITICHELSHLAIKRLDDRGRDVPPSSEEFCSIFGVARMPPDRIDRSRIAYLGYPDVPRQQWPTICRRALDYREQHRNYIQKAQEWLRT